MCTQRWARAAAVLAVAIMSYHAGADNTPVGTTFTYQGSLTEAGEPVFGMVDLQFRLFDQPADGAPLGTLVADDLELGEDGRFTIDLDFGDVFTGEPRWLEIAVNGTTLAPRQPIMASPHAMVATTAASVPTKALTGIYTGITGVGTLNSLDVSGLTSFGSDGVTQIDGNTGHALLRYDNGNVGPIMTLRNHSAQATSTVGSINFEDASGVLAGIEYMKQGQGVEALRFIGPDGTPDMMITDGGNVGIGTSIPTARLHVEGQIRTTVTSNNPAIDVNQNSVSSVSAIHGKSWTQSSHATAVFGDLLSSAPGFNASGVLGQVRDDGSNGVGVRGIHDGTGYGVKGESDGTAVYGLSGGSGIGVYGQSSGSGSVGVRGEAATGVRGIGSTFGVQGRSSTADGYGGSFEGDGFLGAGKALIVWGDSHTLGNVGIGTLEPEVKLHIVGTTRTDVLHITGGSDLSERFDIATIDGITPQPGMVVCIDPANPGKLIPSSRAYDRTVAGIISGANGVSTGMLMGQEGSEADGEYPVALTGRVYVMADATSHAIEPGDLLTTSSVAGCAMAVDDHSRMHGAVIGKAMTGLALGKKGVVLVLVNLQ